MFKANRKWSGVVQVSALSGEGISKRLGAMADAFDDSVSKGIGNAGWSLRNSLRGQVRAAGLGPGLAKAFQVNFYNEGVQRAAWVYSKAATLHAVFNDGATIRAANGTWLAIPLEGAIRFGWSRSFDRSKGSLPRRWSNLRSAGYAYGLQFVRLDGGRAMLVAKPRGGADAGMKLVNGFLPMFLLLPQVRIKKRLDIDGAAQRHFRQAVELIAGGLRKVLNG